MTDLRLRVSGPEDGTPLVLMHALGADLTFWDAMIAEMGPGYRFIRYDQRGLGQSPVPPHNWTMEEHVEDLEQVRRTVGVDQFAIMGTAVGGAISMFYAHRYPERVSAVIFTNPTMGANPKTNTERAAQVAAGGMGAIAEAAVSRAFGELPHDERYVHYRDQLFIKNDPLGYQRTVLGLVEADIRQVLPEIRSPVLLLCGKLDTINPSPVPETIASMIPDARIQWIARAAHFGPYQAPVESAAAARAFLAGRS